MTDRITEKAYEKHAWILLFAIGVFGLVTSLPLLLGVDPDPARIEGIIGMTMSELRASNPRFLDLVTYSVRTYGLVNLAWSFLIIAISVTAYRKGEKWAWCAFWSLPAFYVVSTAILLSIGPIPFGARFVTAACNLEPLGTALTLQEVLPGKVAAVIVVAGSVALQIIVTGRGEADSKTEVE